ncbi:MAG: hypothetical protein IT490_06695, partial [Candidatus Contendobacter sp.]|nr:hypothetical protein [Candidatus Contendobacter sp.]
VYFHELPRQKIALSPIHITLLTPLQVILCRRIAGLADLVWVNQARGLPLLRPAKSKHIEFMPTISSFGVCEKPTFLEKRDPIDVVFGIESKRRRMYAQLACLALDDWQSIGVNQILDIGNWFDETDCLTPIPIPIIRLGQISHEEVMKLLNRVRVGFFTASAEEVSKSSVFAAYTAYGVVPINTEPYIAIYPDDFMPFPGREYLLLTDILTHTDFTSIAQFGKEWLQKYSPELAMKRILEQINAVLQQS